MNDSWATERVGGEAGLAPPRGRVCPGQHRRVRGPAVCGPERVRTRARAVCLWAGGGGRVTVQGPGRKAMQDDPRSASQSRSRPSTGPRAHTNAATHTGPTWFGTALVLVITGAVNFEAIFRKRVRERWFKFCVHVRLRQRKCNLKKRGGGNFLIEI